MVSTLTYLLLVIVLLTTLFFRSLSFLTKTVQVLERIQYKHMPADCSLRCQKQPNSSKGVDVTLCKLKWSQDKSGLFERNLNLPEN